MVDDILRRSPRYRFELSMGKGSKVYVLAAV
jgi:hypothetical protein